MSRKMTLPELKEHYPELINSLLADYSEDRACKLANKILNSLDDLDKLEEDYIVTRTNGYYDVRKKENLAERVRMKACIMAGLRRKTG